MVVKNQVLFSEMMQIYHIYLYLRVKKAPINEDRGFVVVGVGLDKS